MALDGWLGRTVEVVIEVPAGGRVKRRPDGVVDLVSPLGLPWSYGYVPDTVSGDGDPLDAIVLGGRHPAGARVEGPVVGVVDFVDAGRDDPKLLVGAPGRWSRWTVRGFFALYVPLKRGVHRWRGEGGSTRLRGIRWRLPAA